MLGDTVGRDVGRDEGREQAQWRDLVARLEVQGPIDPAEAPWPDRENLRAKNQPGTASSPPGDDPPDDHRPGDGQTDRSRVIKPAGFPRFGRPTEPTAGSADEPMPTGPRDYELDEPREGDLDEDFDSYVPPPLPPQPSLDPVAKGAWLALFGGPGYLLIATLLSWQIAGWEALTAVAVFVAGFVVLVFRLGDGPSKRDGPDQGAVV